MTCPSGFLYGSKCVTSCPSGYVASNGKCIGCDPNCAQCSSSDTSRCITCTSPYYLYNNVCYKSCPYGYIPDTLGIQCIPKPVVVDPGKNDTDPNITDPNGNGTDPKNNGTIYLNTADQAYVYFPVLITQTILTGVGIGSYLKDRNSLPISGIVALYGPLEFVAYGG